MKDIFSHIPYDFVLGATLVGLTYFSAEQLEKNSGINIPDTHKHVAALTVIAGGAVLSATADSIKSAREESNKIKRERNEKLADLLISGDRECFSREARDYYVESLVPAIVEKVEEVCKDRVEAEAVLSSLIEDYPDEGFIDRFFELARIQVSAELSRLDQLSNQQQS